MIIPTQDLTASSDSDTGGVIPYGYSQVNEAITLVFTLMPQELRQFAEQLTKRNPIISNQLIDLLIDAFADQPVSVDVEQHTRIWYAIQAASTAEPHLVMDEDGLDYAGDRYQLLDEDERQLFVAQ